MNSTLETTQEPVAQLATWAAPYNPRKISDHDLEALRRSLRFFGVVEPIVVNRRSGHIVGGHQRVKAAQAEALESMPVVWVDLDDPGERQLNLALNRISGSWDDGKLRDVLIGLDAEGADLALTGFEDEELAALMRELLQPKVDPEKSPNDVQQRCEPGDVWALGRHRLTCGDATLIGDIERVLGGVEPFLCMTDPPYGIDLEYEGHDDSQSALEGLIGAFLPLVRRVAKTTILTPGVPNIWLYPPAEWVLCWFYGGGQSYTPWGFNCWQPVLCYGKDPMLSLGRGARPDGVDMNTPANAADIDHPCPKPLAIWKWLMERCTRPGDSVLDPFGGSGTTLIAAELMGRDAYLIEKSAHYCDVILQRFQDVTGTEVQRAA